MDRGLVAPAIGRGPLAVSAGVQLPLCAPGVGDEPGKLAQPARFFTPRLFLGSLVSAAFGVVIFTLLDRLRRRP